MNRGACARSAVEDPDTCRLASQKSPAPLCLRNRIGLLLCRRGEAVAVDIIGLVCVYVEYARWSLLASASALGMDSVKDLMKNWWHPEKQGMTLKGQVSSLMGRNKGSSSSVDHSNHVSHPLADPRTPRPLRRPRGAPPPPPRPRACLRGCPRGPQKPAPSGPAAAHLNPAPSTASAPPTCPSRLSASAAQPPPPARRALRRDRNGWGRLRRAGQRAPEPVRQAAGLVIVGLAGPAAA